MVVDLVAPPRMDTTALTRQVAADKTTRGTIWRPLLPLACIALQRPLTGRSALDGPAMLRLGTAHHPAQLGDRLLAAAEQGSHAP